MSIKRAACGRVGRRGSRSKAWRRLAPAVALLCIVAELGVPAAAAGTPNIILFSVDDNILPSTWKAVYTDTIVASAARNPNGCRIPATWFIACCKRKTGDCAVVKKAKAAGHELASHSVSHSNAAPTFSYARWAQEVDGHRAWLASCGVPAREVVGWRAPYFLINEVMGTVIQDKGFLYDSSLSGHNASQPAFPLSQLPRSAICSSTEGVCGNWSSLARVWEVPAYLLPGKGGALGQRVDPPPSDDMTALQRLKADFERKRGSGVPVWLGVHEGYLKNQTTRATATSFLRWALSQPDTWALTYRQYVEWRKAPVGTSINSIVGKWRCDTSGLRVVGPRQRW